MKRIAADTIWTMVLTLGIGCSPADDSHDPVPRIERDGEVFDLLAMPAEPAQPNGGRELPSAMALDGPVRAFPGDASRERLADDLRSAVMDRSGVVYVQRQPNWRAADAVLGSDRTQRFVDYDAERAERGARLRTEAALEELDGNPEERLGEVTQPFIVGGDGRTLANVAVHPHGAIARLSIGYSDGGAGTCSGAYIGPWTLVTSAHCLVSTGSVATRIRFQPQRAGASIPHDFNCRLDDASSTNDISWAVPEGYRLAPWDSPAPAHQLDYAVIDTWPCHAAPFRFAGYAVWPNDATYSMYGYPGDTCPGASAPGTFQCGMAGPAYDTDGWILETEHIDSVGGQSGGPWFRRLSGINRVMGIHAGGRTYFDFGRCGFDNCVRNYARLIDDAVDAFIKLHAFDY